jgi:uncharacterized membrane protein
MFMATWAGSCLAMAGCSMMSCCTNQLMLVSARFAYCILFALAMVLTWIMRDFGKPLLEKIPCALQLACLLISARLCQRVPQLRASTRQSGC